MTQTDPRDGDPTPSNDVQVGAAPRLSDGEGRRELWNQLDQSSIMSVELIAAILVWGGVGWLLDGWLGTTPWLFGFGVMIGFGAGLYLVWMRSDQDRIDRNAAARARTRNDDTTKG